jgi:hypothetical protein
MSYDIYHNPVQMNTETPAIAGTPSAYGPTTPQEMAAGHGAGSTYGASLNYVAPAPQLAPTAGAGMTPASQLTSISPSDLASQLLADANAAGGH